MWTYAQRTGRLIGPKGEFVSTGYSGYGNGKNNPAMQYVKAIGPVCVGKYTIGEPHTSKNVGPYAMNLTPHADTETKGRGDFMIHGDSISKPGAASHGCIIFNRAVRERIWNSGDHELTVTE